MTYGRLKAKYEKAAADRDELDSLARAYVKSSSMSEFRLKAHAAGIGKSKFMKWFRLFYFVKNYGVYRAFPPLVVMPAGILYLLALAVYADAVSVRSDSLGWQAMCALVFLTAVVGGCLLSFLALQHMSSMLDKVKNAVEKY